jgi:MYXO-CTERM domain-containing protein
MIQWRSRRVVRASVSAGVVAAALATPGAARAQIGGGWTKLTLTEDFIDTQSMGQHARHPVASFTTSGARYEKTADAETFELYDPSFNRVEHDTNYHYKTGSIQFEGTVQIYPGVNHQFIIQLFNAPASGPIMALSAFSRDNGTIIKQGGSVEVATNIFGKDLRVNIIHDLNANTLSVYIDGKQAWTGGGGAGGGFNFKYGSYGSLGESRSAKARWQNVQFWTGGSASGSGPPADAAVSRDAAVDGAAADAASSPDSAPARDADRGAAPDAGVDRAAAADASSGAGGAGGSGPDGTGGSGTVAPPPGGGSGCGCRVGRPSRGDGAAALAAVLVAIGLRRRRRAR